MLEKIFANCRKDDALGKERAEHASSGTHVGGVFKVTQGLVVLVPAYDRTPMQNASSQDLHDKQSCDYTSKSKLEILNHVLPTCVSA